MEAGPTEILPPIQSEKIVIFGSFVIKSNLLSVDTPQPQRLVLIVCLRKYFSLVLSRRQLLLLSCCLLLGDVQHGIYDEPLTTE